MAAIAEPVERVELGQHLGIRLGARHAAVQFDDVAELAGERTAARILQPDVEVMLELQEVKTRDRRLGHIDLEFRRLEEAAALAPLPGGDEFLDDTFGFAD